MTLLPASPSVGRRRPFADVPPDARQYAVRMRDGVLLATDVYLPSSARRWPVLVSRLPYDKAGDECFMPQVARWFNERGYAVVVQDVRGKLRSGGDLAPFTYEVADGYDTIDWVVSRPWCSGAVGMVGDSYYGFTQWAAAASRHPTLRAIAPRVTVPDFSEVLDRQGVFMLEVAACWALETWVDEALYDYEGQLDWSVRPLADIVPAALGGRRPVGLDAWAAGGIDDAARLPVHGAVPALHLAGFWDFIQRGQIAGWQQAHAKARAPQYLLIDAVDHGWTDLRDPGQPYDDPQRGPAAMARFLDRYLGQLVPFYDRFLRERGDYQVAPVRWRQSRDRWYEDTEWPPRDSRPLTWSLVPGSSGRSDHVLALRNDRAPTTAQWVHDPLGPVPSLVHPYYPLIDPPDERAVAARADVLAFASEELTEPLDLAGPVAATVLLTSSAPSAHLMATLVDVYPDGSAYRILDGAVAVAAPWSQAVTVDLGHAGYRLHPGHRLALHLASSAFPRYALHPGTSADPWSATEFQRAEQSIVLGGPAGARLTCFTFDDRSTP